MRFPETDEDGFGPTEVAESLDVSRETMERVQAFVGFLDVWRNRLNLIGPNEGRHLWRRHILDSLQLATFVPESTRNLVDLGTGGGFPGILLAITLGDRDVAVSLVEKSVRKAEFLEAAVEALGLNAVVLNQRIEEDSASRFEVVTARALAPLPKLLGLVNGWLADDGRAILLKGKDRDQELIHIRETWTFDLETRPSLSGPDGHILLVSSLKQRVT